MQHKASTDRLQKLALKKFRDWTWSDLNIDYHMHTDRTDGQGDMESVIRRATEVGLHRIAITEHLRHDTDWFGEFAVDIRCIREKHPERSAG
jgi:hypothetical protein